MDTASSCRADDTRLLGLDLCWEDGRLRWRDPAAQPCPLTFDETDEARSAAEARVRELEAELERRGGG